MRRRSRQKKGKQAGEQGKPAGKQGKPAGKQGKPESGTTGKNKTEIEKNNGSSEVKFDNYLTNTSSGHNMTN